MEVYSGGRTERTKRKSCIYRMEKYIVEIDWSALGRMRIQYDRCWGDCQCWDKRDPQRVPSNRLLSENYDVTPTQSFQLESTRPQIQVSRAE